MKLGRKQSIDNKDWAETFERIKETVSKADIEKLVNQTVDNIKKTTKGKKTAYAWSAGKDSLVLSHICEKSGIKDCMLAVCNLEYPAFVEWIEQNKPTNLEIINTGQDMKWLSKHPNMLFPKDSSIAGRWFSIVQHTAQEKYFKKQDLDMLILGRRKIDGNYTGKDNLYTNIKGITRYSPLADWSHEHILAYIHYNNLLLPPIYSWLNGWKCGTHPWPARQWTGSIENGWKEIYRIDKSIVESAAAVIPSAADFLRGIRHEPK